jgi:hypothetical protein
VHILEDGAGEGLRVMRREDMKDLPRDLPSVRREGTLLEADDLNSADVPVGHTEMLVGGPSFLPAKLKMTVTALLVNVARFRPPRASRFRVRSRRTLGHQVPRPLQEEDLSSVDVAPRPPTQAHGMYSATLVDGRRVAVGEEVDDGSTLGRESHDIVLAASRLLGERRLWTPSRKRAPPAHSPSPWPPRRLSRLSDARRRHLPGA